jgi:two-component system OmpR family response regulator
VRVLVVEDDDNLRIAISTSLRGSGFAVDAVHDLPPADQALAVNAYDCAVFDRMLPAGDALSYVRAIRARGSQVPILFLTALDRVTDRVAGFAGGADDYLVKPFAMEELTARVRSLCRRVAPELPQVLSCGDLQIDRARHEARRAGVLLTLTSKEFAVLTLLVTHQRTPVPRATLIAHAWDPHSNPTSNVLDQVITQLRRKLHNPPMIHTAHKIGYRIDPA